MRPIDDPGEREEREAWRTRVGDFDKVADAARALLAGNMGPIAESLSESGIGRPTIRLDPPEASLDHAPLKALHRYWTERRGPDGALALKTGGGLGIFYRAMQMASAMTRRPVESLHNSPNWISASTWRRFTVPFLDEAGAATHFLVATVPVAFRSRTPEEEAEFARRLAPGKPN